MNATVWVVDDRASNRRVFRDIVRTLGHQVEVFEGGPQALEAATLSVPDLVLLDVMMPEMDGFETCRRFRQQFGDELVPIVMITAHDDGSLYTRGLDAGADDYLLQPVDYGALRARVEGMLRQRELYLELLEAKRTVDEHVDKLREEIANTERQLFVADRLSTVGLFAAGIAHELKNPLAAVRFSLSYCEGAQPDDLRDGEFGEALGTAQAALRQMVELLQEITTFASPDIDDKPVCASTRTIESAVRIAQHAVELSADIERDYRWSGNVAISPSSLGQVMLNLIINAAHAIKSTGKRGVISVTVTADDGWVEISLDDNGSGVAPERRERLFEPFYTTKAATGGSGLGLAICRALLQRFEGTIRFEPLDPGSRFVIRLPAKLDTSSGE